MNFGKAIEELKAGKRVVRKGWNGKGMFLIYVPSATDRDIEYGAYIAMKTAQNNIIPWLASQADMLSEDWEVIE